MNVVITGGSRGIGKAVAEKFAEDKQGHTIFLCARNKEHWVQFAKELQDGSRGQMLTAKHAIFR